MTGNEEKKERERERKRKRDRVQRQTQLDTSNSGKKSQTFQMIEKLDFEIREFVLVLQVFLKRKKLDKEKIQGESTFS